MWNALFGSNPPFLDPREDEDDEEQSISEEIVYLVQGSQRIPLKLPPTCQRNPIGLRQWVFDTIARLPLEENIEYYTFKVLPNGFIYWYSLYSSKRDDVEDAYGILMMFDDQQGIFTGVSDQNGELPQVQSPKRVEELIHISIVEDEDSNNNKATTSAKPRSVGTKRGRSKK